MAQSAVVAVTTLLAPLAALAQGQVNPPTTLSGLLQLIRNLSRTAFAVLFVLAVVIFMVGAFYYLFGGQKDENKTKGRQFIQYGVIALVVGFLAFGLAEVVTNLLSAQGQPAL